MLFWLTPINQTSIQKKRLGLHSCEVQKWYQFTIISKKALKPYPLYANLCVPVAHCEVLFGFRYWAESTDTIAHSFLSTVRIIPTLICPGFEITLGSAARALAGAGNKHRLWMPTKCMNHSKQTIHPEAYSSIQQISDLPNRMWLDKNFSHSIITLMYVSLIV